jgi:hypothetical protein
VNLRLKNPDAQHHTYVNVTGFLTTSSNPETAPPHLVPVAASTNRDLQHYDPTYLTINPSDLRRPDHRLIPDSLLPPLDFDDNLVLPDPIPTMYTVPDTSCYSPLIQLARKLFRTLKRSSKKKKQREEKINVCVETFVKDNFVFSRL